MAEREIKIPARSISLLVEIKQNLLANNDLSINMSGCGNLAAAHYIDNLIENATKMETLFHDYRMNYNLTKEAFDEYRGLLRYFPEEIDGERKKELEALVSKWEKQDEAEGEDENA